LMSRPLSANKVLGVRYLYHSGSYTQENGA
jgi:hypothetical protein